MVRNKYPREVICYVHRKKIENIVKTFLSSGLDVCTPGEEFKYCIKISESAHPNRQVGRMLPKSRDLCGSFQIL
jgi:hypothetical protein